MNMIKVPFLVLHIKPGVSPRAAAPHVQVPEGSLDPDIGPGLNNAWMPGPPGDTGTLAWAWTEGVAAAFGDDPMGEDWGLCGPVKGCTLRWGLSTWAERVQDGRARR